MMFEELDPKDEPEVRQEYLDKLEKIRKQKSIHVGNLDNFKKIYGIE